MHTNLIFDGNNTCDNTYCASQEGAQNYAYIVSKQREWVHGMPFSFLTLAIQSSVLSCNVVAECIRAVVISPAGCD